MRERMCRTSASAKASPCRRTEQEVELWRGTGCRLVTGILSKPPTRGLNWMLEEMKRDAGRRSAICAVKLPGNGLA